MSHYSMLVPFAPRRPEELLPYAALAQWSSAGRLWQGQGSFNDPHGDFMYVAACGFRVPTGIGVTLMPFRHPHQAVVQARALAVASGHPVVAGYGPGAVAVQRSALGAPYRSQLGAVHDYVAIMRCLLADGKADYVGEYFTCRSELPLGPAPLVEIGLGVLRPGMARLAGEVADAAITWLTPASYLRDTVVPAVREGAAAAGRLPPRVVAIVPVALAAPDRDPTMLVLSSNAAHLQLPHYADMLRRAGVVVDPDDPAVAAPALTGAGAFLYGDLDELATRLAEFADAGVDEIVLNVSGVFARYGTRVALEELELLLSRAAS